MVKRSMPGGLKTVAWPNVAATAKVAMNELASWPTESIATIVYENAQILEVDLLEKFAKDEANVIAVYHHKVHKNGKTVIREFI